MYYIFSIIVLTLICLIDAHDMLTICDALLSNNLIALEKWVSEHYSLIDNVTYSSLTKTNKAQFDANYRRKYPVLIKNSIDNWPSFEEFIATFGDTKIKVKMIITGSYRYYTTLSTYIFLLYRQDLRHLLYILMAEQIFRNR